MSMDELLSRQVPQSLEAEQSVLGSMLIDERCVPDVIALLQPDEFYLQQNRDIYRDDLHDVQLLAAHRPRHRARQDERARASMTRRILTTTFPSCLQITPTAANVRQYCAIVHDKALHAQPRHGRRMRSPTMVQEGVGTAQEILEASQKRIYSASQGKFGRQPPAHRKGAAERLRPPGGACRVRQRHSGSVHRPA